jgi:hypothetical protein
MATLALQRGRNPTSRIDHRFGSGRQRTPVRSLGGRTCVAAVRTVRWLLVALWRRFGERLPARCRRRLPIDQAAGGTAVHAALRGVNGHLLLNRISDEYPGNVKPVAGDHHSMREDKHTEDLFIEMW